MSYDLDGELIQQAEQMEDENSPGALALREHEKATAMAEADQVRADTKDNFAGYPQVDAVNATAKGAKPGGTVVPNSSIPVAPIFGHDAKTGQPITSNYAGNETVRGAVNELGQSWRNISGDRAKTNELEGIVPATLDGPEKQATPYSDDMPLTRLAIEAPDFESFTKDVPEQWSESQKLRAWDNAQYKRDYDLATKDLQTLNKMNPPKVEPAEFTMDETRNDAEFINAARELRKFYHPELEAARESKGRAAGMGVPDKAAETEMDDEEVSQWLVDHLRAFDGNIGMQAFVMSNLGRMEGAQQQAYLKAFEKWDKTGVEWTPEAVAANVGWMAADPTNLIGLTTGTLAVTTAARTAAKLGAKELIESQVQKQLMKTAAKGVGKNMAVGATAGGIAGAHYEGVKELISGQELDAGKIGTSAAISAAAGAVLGPLVPEAVAIAAPGVKKAWAKLSGGEYLDPNDIAALGLQNLGYGRAVDGKINHGKMAEMLDAMKAPHAPENVVYDQLIKAGVDREKAAVQARITGRWYETLGRHTGRTGAEMMQADPLHIKAGEPAGDLMQYGGINAKTAPDTLGIAEDYITAGVDPEKVRQLTGWHFGEDGLPRFEISDAEMRPIVFDPIRGDLTLKDVIRHDKLFAAYPELANTRVKTFSEGGANGSYDPDLNEIHVRMDPYDTKLNDAQASTILHEIQHAIQTREGFASGSSPEMFTSGVKFGADLRPLTRLVSFVNNFSRKSQEGGEEFFGDYAPSNAPDIDLDQLLESALGHFSQDELDQPVTPEVQEVLRHFFDADVEVGAELGTALEQVADKARAALNGSVDDRTAFEQYRDTYGEAEARDTQARAGLDEETRRILPPNLSFKGEPIILWNDVPMKSVGEPAPAPRVKGEIPEDIDNLTSLASTFQLAESGTFATNRELKVAMQDRVNAAAAAAKVDLKARTPVTRKYLARVGLKDALESLKSNDNAIGWYDKTVSKALDIVSLIHPEINTDPKAKFAFTWALAVTSNGIKVDKNFQLAEAAYQHFKATGKMPTDIKAGNAAKAMNESMRVYNELIERYGDDLQKFMATEFRAGDVDRITGIKPTGENADTVVLGASILGPKIGNGFFSNLNGRFDQLTMDRWLMRTVGRWTGNLIEPRPDMVRLKRTELGDAIRKLSKDGKKAFEAALGSKLLIGDLDGTALAIAKASVSPETRALFNSIPGGEDIRKVGNSLTKYHDGQKEAPDNGDERNFIREVFSDILGELQKQHPGMTMADLQALLWYPERRLYDKAKSSDEVGAGYADDEAPDYANAAAQLAKDMGVDETAIQTVSAEHAARNSAGPTQRGAGEPDSTATITQRAAGFDEGERRSFVRDATLRSFRRDRPDSLGQSFTQPKSSNKGLGGSGRVALSPPKALSNAMKAAGLYGGELHAVEKPDDFLAAMDKALSNQSMGAAVTRKDPEELAGAKMFMTPDGSAGLAVIDGDIVSLFKDPSVKGPTPVPMLIELAIQNGGVKLDAFETVLPHLYAPHGFRTVARVKFVDGITPGWDYEKFKNYNGGRPDLVMMVLDRSYQGKHSSNDGKLFDDYDEAIAFRDSQIGTKLNQDAGPEQPRGTYDVVNQLIELGKNADNTTFSHELAHHHLEMLIRQSEAPDAPQSLKDEVAGVMELFELTPEQWKGMSLEQKRPFHEQYAQSFEKYLGEGDSKVKGLGESFELMKQWMGSLVEDLPEMSPGVKEWFDRSLTPRAKMGPVSRSLFASAARKAEDEEPVPREPYANIADAMQPQKLEQGPAADSFQNRPTPDKYIETGTINTNRHHPGAAAAINKGMMDVLNANDLAKLMEKIGEDNGFSDPVRTHDEVGRANMIEQLEPILGGRQTGLASDKQLYAMRSAVATLGDQAVTIAREIKGGNQSAQKLLEYEQTVTQLVAMQGLLTNNVREVARALSQQRMIARVVSKNDIEAMQRMITGGPVDPNAIVLSATNLVNGVNAGQTATKALGKAMRSGTWLEASIEFWKSNILSGPQTHMINIMGNTLYVGYWNALVRPTAGLIGSTRMIMGVGTPGVSITESMAGIVGSITGVMDGLRGFMHVIMTNEPVLDQGANKMDQGKSALQQKVGDTAAAVMTPAYRLLTAEDELFKTIAYRGEIAALATREALSRGMDMQATQQHIADQLDYPSAELHGQALEAARVVTFQDTKLGGGLIGQLGQSVMTLLSKMPALKFIFPFVSTPTNVAVAGIESTALSVMSPKLWKDIMKGGATADVAMAKMVAGTALTAVAYGIYQAGHLTGTGPEDYKQLELLKQTGWRPNSIHIGGKWYDINRLDPFGSALVSVAGAFDHATFARREVDVAGAMIGAMGAFADRMANMPFLTGMQSLFQLGTTGSRGIAQMAGNVAAGFVPYSGMVGFIARASDDVDRIPNKQAVGFAGEGTTADLAESFMQPLRSRTPWARDGMRPKRNWDGTVAMPEGGMLLAQMDPFKTSKAKDDPVTKRMVENGVVWAEPTPIISIPGTGVSVSVLDMDNGQGIAYDRYLQRVGEARREAVSEMIDMAPDDIPEGPQSEMQLAMTRAMSAGKLEGTRRFITEDLPAMIESNEIDATALAEMIGDDLDTVIEKAHEGAKLPGRVMVRGQGDQKIVPSGSGVPVL